MYAVSRHPAVVDDMASIYAYISDSDTAADRVLDCIERAIQTIAEYPRIGMRFETDVPKLGGVRMFTVPRYRQYIVFYRFEQATVRILYVLHGARDLVRTIESDVRD